MSEKADTPDTPADVLERQAKSRALTPQTAELIGASEYVDEGGRMTSARRSSQVTSPAKRAAELYAGGTPVMGMDALQVSALRGKSYPAGPKMESELGDRTPAFVNWLWAKHPAEAKVRYAYRDIWPTVLPAIWPPKPLPKAKPKAKAPAAPSTATV